MKGRRFVGGFTLFALLAAAVLLKFAYRANGAEAPKARFQPESPAEKSVLTESSKHAAKPVSDQEELCQCMEQKETSAAKKIEQVLAGPLHSNGIDVADQPLIDILMQLQDEYQIPIQLDTTALEEAGVGSDSPVTRTFRNISLRSALKLMLEPLKLTWIIRDEVLMVTTTEVAERRLVTCVYNVQGLVDDGDPKSMDALIDAIVTCVAPGTWSENGGKQADIRPLIPGLLVVSQTSAIHEEVKGLLAKIRKAREQVPISKARPRVAEPAPSHSPPNPSQQPQKVRDTGADRVDENPFSS